MYPPKLYSGPTIQSRSAARRAAQDLVKQIVQNEVLVQAVGSGRWWCLFVVLVDGRGWCTVGNLISWVVPLVLIMLKVVCCWRA